MIKSHPIITSVLFLVFVVLIWRASLLLNNLVSLLPETETKPEVGLDTDVNWTQKIFDPDTFISGADTNNTGYYETIEETMTRLKRDVVVTGTITGTSGKESAMFQIENMPDRSFDINTQLMDGFIITEITQTQVTLKNQSGDESFSLPVQYDNDDKSMPPEPINSEFLPVAEPVQTDPVDHGYPPESRLDEIRSSESRQDDLRQTGTNAVDSAFSPEPEYQPESGSPESIPTESGQMEPVPADYGYTVESISEDLRQREINPVDPITSPPDNQNN